MYGQTNNGRTDILIYRGSSFGPKTYSKYMEDHWWYFATFLAQVCPVYLQVCKHCRKLISRWMLISKRRACQKLPKKTRLLPKKVPRGAIGAQRTNFYIEIHKYGHTYKHTYIRTDWQINLWRLIRASKYRNRKPFSLLGIQQRLR